MTQSENRYDLLRLVFAGCVFVYHGAELLALQPFGALGLGLAPLAELGIQGFFIVSGVLVTGSLERSASLADYAGKRVRRLYPAYVVVLLIPALTSLVLTGAWEGIAKYLGANLVFLNFLAPDLPGLFETNRFSEVNGALWTLKIEVMFYAVLPLLIFALRKAGRAQWLVMGLIYLAAEAWRQGLPSLSMVAQADQLARQLPGQMAFFISGMALWRLQAWIRPRAGLIFFGGAFVLALSYLLPFAEVLRAASLMAVIGAAALAPGPALPVARYGDISYGLYITHFPILQTIAAFHLTERIGFWPAFGLATVIVLAVSFALWHLIEKPALRTDSHYRRAKLIS